jgi:hypothetical protein
MLVRGPLQHREKVWGASVSMLARFGEAQDAEGEGMVPQM